jgi:NADPH:quinone reductase-like Zn-dependent oxidoreductase
MRCFAVSSIRNREFESSAISVGETGIDGIPILAGIIVTSDPDFDKHLPKNNHKVLIKTNAFSCNFRDKNLIIPAVSIHPKNSYYVVGSEFVGEVIDVGNDVSTLEIGDRVIGDNNFTGFGKDPITGIMDGIPTNHASKEFQIINEDKLIKIPSQMPDEIGAGFSIGAQTAYSMIRKLNLVENINLLITSSKSNTSLFVINALKKYRINIYALSTSSKFKRELLSMGVKELIPISSQDVDYSNNKKISQIIRCRGLFSYVIDPFFDLHINKVINIIAPQGKYITCGLCNQNSTLSKHPITSSEGDMSRTIIYSILRNISIIGNCLGLTQDIKNALLDYSIGKFDVSIDSVFREEQTVKFLNRTYNDKERFGKVIFKYTD